jgi:hypothetical protein
MWGAALTGALHGAQLASAVLGIQGALQSAVSDAVIVNDDATTAPQTSGDFTNAANSAPDAPSVREFPIKTGAFLHGNALSVDFGEPAPSGGDEHWGIYLNKVKGPGLFHTDYSGWVVVRTHTFEQGIDWYRVGNWYHVQGSIWNWTNSGTFTGHLTSLFHSTFDRLAISQ